MFSRRLLLATLALATTVPFVSVAPALADPEKGFRPVPPGRVQPALEQYELGGSKPGTQSLQTTKTAPPPSPAFVDQGNGVLQARLPAMTCVASVNGTRFVPHVDGFPRTDLSLRYSLESISAGTEVVFARGDQTATPTPPESAGASTILFRYPGIDERYDARADGIEQSFVLASDSGLRSGADLVITGTLGTTLTSTVDGAGGLVFSDGPRRVLTYGAATAIDAAGRRIQGTVSADAGALTIVVPGDWLAEAAFPVVVDPLIGNLITVTNTAVDERSPAIAYNATNDRFLVIWDELGGPNDHDIYAALYAGDGTPIVPLIVIDTFLDDSVRPAAAWNAVSNQFIVGWEENQSLVTAGAPNSIVIAFVDSAGTKINGVNGSILFFQSTALHRRLKLAGRTDVDAYLMVWDTLPAGAGTTSNLIFFQLSSTLMVGTGINIGFPGNDFEPAVNAVGAAPTPWYVAFTTDNFPPDTDVLVLPVTPTAGSLTTAIGNLNNGIAFGGVASQFNDRRPTVAGTNPWVIASEVEFAAAPLDVDIFANIGTPTGTGTQLIGVGFALEVETNPSAAFYNGPGTDEYVFAYTLTAAGGQTNIVARRTDTALAEREPATPLTAPGADDLAAAAARLTPADAEYAVAFQRQAGTLDVLMQRFGGPPPAPIAEFSGTPRTGAAPLDVTFTNLTAGGTAATFLWTFGDGTTSTAPNPGVHQYATPDAYTVSLQATGPGGSDTETKTNYIMIPPVADFTAAPTSSQAPIDVTFTNTSTGNGNTYVWDFGDGTPTVATPSPVHTYQNNGTYTVTLTANGAGGSDTETKTNLIVLAPLGANFTIAPTTGNVSQTYTFTDTSTGGPTAWAWDFGDGTMSTLQSPTKAYTASGNFTVTLTVTRAAAMSNVSKGLSVTPDANFTATPSPATGPPPLAVQFMDTSLGGATSRSWNFGDGSPADTTANPSHTYTLPGAYNVSLTVTGAGGSETETKNGFVTVRPVALFTGTPLSGPSPLTVTFTNSSTFAPGSTFSWSFGDGTMSTAQNPPAKQYTNGGKFTVALTVTGPGGTDTQTRTDYVSVTPDADFSPSAVAGSAPFTVQFTNLTSGSGTITYAWAFGDGGTSTATNPAHTYTAAGTYTVTLTATGPGGPNVETKTNLIVVGAAGAPPVAEFTANPTTGVPPLTVQFTDQSTAGSAAIQSYSWDFGDGTTSTARNPMHTYATSGTFSVTLTVRDTAGQTATRTQPNLVVTNPLAGGGGGGATFQVRNRGGGGGGCALADTGTHPSAALPFAAALVGLVLLRLRSRRRRLEAATLPRA